jgi:hypothetical protein
LVNWAAFRALGLAGFAPVLCFGCCFSCFASLVVLLLLSLLLLFFPTLLRLFRSDPGSGGNKKPGRGLVSSPARFFVILF